MKHYFFDGNTRLWGRKKKWQVVKKPLAEKKKSYQKKSAQEKDMILYSGECMLQAGKKRQHQIQLTLSTD